MKYAIANKKVILSLKAKGIFIDHPFNKSLEKYSIYELRKNDILYVNSYSWYMAYFWVNREYLKNFKIKIAEIVNNRLYVYDYPSLNADFNDFLKIKKKEISKIKTYKSHIKNFLQDIYEIKEDGIDLENDFKPYILNKDIQRIISSLSNTKKEKKEYIDYLLSSKLSLINPYCSIAAYFLKKYNLVDKKIALYSFSCAYRSHILTKNLIKKGVFLYAKKCNDKYEKLKNAYFLPEHLISCMDNFDFLIYSSLSSILPIKPKKIYIQHDIFDSPFGYAERVINLKNKKILTPLLEKADKIVVANKIIKEKYDKLYKEVNIKSRVKVIDYLKFDEMLKKFNKKNSKFIVYAPSLLDKKCEKHHSLPYFGEKLIDKLLKNKIVVFRPHPQNYNHPLVKKIVNRFRYHKHFIFDNNANDYLNYYANSKLLITDISGTGYTYAFLTQNPVLFLSPNEKFIKKDLGNLKFFEYRNKIGKVKNSLKNIEKEIDKLIVKKPIYKLNILKLRDKLIANIGKSEKFLLKELNES